MQQIVFLAIIFLGCTRGADLPSIKRLPNQDEEPQDPNIIAIVLPPCPPGTQPPRGRTGARESPMERAERDLPFFRILGPDGKLVDPSTLPVAPFKCTLELPPCPPGTQPPRDTPEIRHKRDLPFLKRKGPDDLGPSELPIAPYACEVKELPPCPPGTRSPRNGPEERTKRDLPMFKRLKPDGTPEDTIDLPVAPFECKMEEIDEAKPGPAPGSNGNIWNLPIPFCEDEVKPGDPVEMMEFKELDLPMFDRPSRRNPRIINHKLEAGRIKRENLPWIKIAGEKEDLTKNGVNEYRFCISKNIIMAVWNKGFDFARHMIQKYGNNKVTNSHESVSHNSKGKGPKSDKNHEKIHEKNWLNNAKEQFIDLFNFDGE